MIYVKNISGSTKTWVGMQLADSGYYLLDNLALIQNWAEDETFIKAYAAGEAIMAYDDSGSNDISDFILGLDLLRKEFLPQKTQSVLGTDNKKTLIFGDDTNTITTITKNTTGVVDLLIESKYLNGGIVRIWNPAKGDSYTITTGDKDAVVVPQAVIDAAGGFYAVASPQIKNCPVSFDSFKAIGSDGYLHVDFESSIISDPLPAGLYSRISYTSVGTVDDVEIAYSLKGFDDK